MTNRILTVPEIIENLAQIPRLLGMSSKIGELYRKGLEVRLHVKGYSRENKLVTDILVFRIFSYDNMLYSYIKMSSGVEIINTSTMKGRFSGNLVINLDVSNFDTSKVTDMSSMFNNKATSPFWSLVRTIDDEMNPRGLFDFKDLRITEIYGIDLFELLFNDGVIVDFKGLETTLLHVISNDMFEISRMTYQLNASEAVLFYGTFLTCFGGKKGFRLALTSHNGQTAYLLGWADGSDPFKIKAYLVNSNRGMLNVERKVFCMNELVNLFPHLEVRDGAVYDGTEEDFIGSMMNATLKNPH